MKLKLTNESWILDELHPIEWEFLSQLEEIAAGKEASAKALRRLKPNPLESLSEQTGDHDEFLDDWKELVQPELDIAFAAAREQVADDLSKACGANPSQADRPSASRVEVANEHTELWYSALNQARLLMNEVHDIAGASERFGMSPDPGEEIDPSEWLGRLMLLARYEFYTALQSVLVEHLMRP